MFFSRIVGPAAKVMVKGMLPKIHFMNTMQQLSEVIRKMKTAEQRAGGASLR
jgi:hypothetical protein